MADRDTTWGFVTYIVESAEGSKGGNPSESNALTALRDFLVNVNITEDQGLVVFAAAAEIADLVEAQEA